MNKYELLYLVSNQYTDAEVEKIAEQVVGEVTGLGGTVIASRVIGKIRLAYPIKKQRHGTYVLVYFDAEPSALETLSRKLTLTDELLRHTMTTRREGAEKKRYELTSYVAPLSEEARALRGERQGPRERLSEERAPIVARPLPPPTPSVTSTNEQKMSIEELDKKLDELLESDITENI